MRLAPLLLLPPLLLLGGCGQDATLRGDASPPSLLGAWELVEGRVDGHPGSPPGTRAPLVVSEETLGGTAFCNYYGSPYELRDGVLVLEALAGRWGARPRSWRRSGPTCRCCTGAAWTCRSRATGW